MTTPPGPQGPLRLTPPKTRATQAWTLMWRALGVDYHKMTQRTRIYSSALRRIGTRR